ncbi:permease [Gordonia sp. PDNC005]|uniref:purine-cytosine permease family protein n=1 Tax=unclassified Gordonia (in: high G+C Gram-positive bacteria) TaxID=2657482 RepID=UPI0019653588|nr:permease [Gordonia sp. PDNC005]QRY61153.1 permease [Gordonia sp. PDNC005]
MSNTEMQNQEAAEPIGKWSLSMAWWSLFSAMFWLYLSAASAAAYGPKATVSGLVLTIVSYGVVNALLATYSLRTGNTVQSVSQLLFGKVGATIASLLIAVTALYYGVFEGSVIAHTLEVQFGGNIKVWYAICVAYAVPLAFGGVRDWLDRLNGFLLPFYVVGLVALVVFATVKQGYPTGWLTAPALGSSVPGWLGSYAIFMGVWVMMMFTMDFASMGRSEDADFHRRATFGPLFYACTFGINGLIGIYVVTAFGSGGTEGGVVEAVLGSLGIFGVILIVISQTRINTANYYLASSNFENVVKSVFGVDLPRIIWVVICGVAAFSLMLTDVLSYLLTAMAWQAVLIVAWASVVIVRVALRRDWQGDLASDSDPALRPLAAAWFIASVVGVTLHQQTSFPALSAVAPIITFAVGAGLGWLLLSFDRTRTAVEGAPTPRPLAAA